jgi:hypothetical protein
VNTLEDVNLRLRLLVENVLSLPPGFMRPANQRADAGAQGGAFGTVLIMAPRNVGMTAARDVESDGNGGYLESLESPVVFTASVQFFKSAPRPADLKCAPISDVVSTYTGVTNGGFNLAVDGATLNVTGLNFSSCPDMPTLVATLQAALTGLSAGVTAIWTGARIVIASSTTGPTSSVACASAPTGFGSPVDVSTLLGMTAAAGASPSDNKTQIAKWNLDAIELARRLPLVMQFGQSADYLRQRNLGYLSAGPARDLSFLADGATWEGRASIDLTFNFIARETLEISTLTEGNAGLIFQPPGGPDVDDTITITQ